MRNAITETTAVVLLIALAATILVAFDVVGMVGERLTDGFQPLLRGAGG